MAVMADNMIEDEFPWLSAELRILEAEYEKSKLQVFQDTLLCKRSMVELELLIKNERLQKNARVNNKIRKHESQLQQQLETLSTELQNTTKQLQTAQGTLQDEKVHHDLERKKLEDKLNSKMEKKIEEQRKSASQREKSLQKEIKNLQAKHVQTFKEVEDLRMELGRKNVAMKTKAIQTRVTVEDASTMAQADLQTCDIGVQVLETISKSVPKKDKEVRKTDGNVNKVAEGVRTNSPPPESLLAAYRTNDDDVHMIDEGVRKTDEYVRENGEDFRETDEDVQETDDVRNRGQVVTRMDEPVRGRKGVPEPKKRANDKRILKNVQPGKNVGRNAKRNVKEKEANKGKDTANKVTDKKEDKENPKASLKRKPSKQEIGSDSNNAMAKNNAKDLHERAKTSNAWLLSSVLQEEDIPLQYSKTPGRVRITSDESNQSREMKTDKNVGTCSGEEMAGSVTETSASDKSSECSFKKPSQLLVFVEDIGNKRALKGNKSGAELEEVSHKEDVHDDDDAAEKSTQDHPVESSQPVLKKDEKCFLGLTERQKRLEQELIGSKRANFSDHGENKDSSNVQNKNEKAGKVKEKRENKKRKKTKKVKCPKEKGCEDTSPDDERSEHEGAQNKGGRVLRQRTAKKRNCDVELDPCKGQVEVGTEARQEPPDNSTIATEKNDKIDDRSLKGHEPVMSLMSSPDANQLPRESELSSREIDPLVDENPVTSQETSQQPETEVQGGPNKENNKAAEGERLMDYNLAQGGSDKNDNRIKEAGKKAKQDCFHKELRKKKSGKSSNEAKNKINAENNKKETKNIDLCSTERNDHKQTRKNSEHEDAYVSKEKDTDVVNIDSNESLTRQKVKSTIFPDTIQSKRKDSKHRCGKTETASKENAPSSKTRGQKRKPTSSMSEVLAPADRQSCGSNVTSTSTEMSSMLDNTKKRKTLFNSRENSLMVPNAKVQISFANTTLSKSRASTGIPPSLSAFMRSFIAPKLKKSH